MSSVQRTRDPLFHFIPINFRIFYLVRRLSMGSIREVKKKNGETTYHVEIRLRGRKHAVEGIDS